MMKDLKTPRIPRGLKHYLQNRAGGLLHLIRDQPSEPPSTSAESLPGGDEPQTQLERLRKSLAADENAFLADVLVPHLRKSSWTYADAVWRAAHKRLESDERWRYGPHRVARLYQKYRKDAGDLAGKRTLDFGCGHKNPLALSALFYANGAKETFAIDLLSSREDLTADGLFVTLREALALPHAFKDDGQPYGTFSERIHKFNLKALAAGDLTAGLGEAPVRYHIIHPDEYPEYLPEIDFVFSHSVLEHVQDFESVMRKLRAVMAQGATMSHHVDFNDHRRRKRKHRVMAPWKFLTENSEYARTYCNRLRFSEMEALLVRAGFDILEAHRSETPYPPKLRKKLLPEFQHLSDEDLRTLAGSFLVQTR